ncbi:AsmA family protein [Nitrobacter winogradskyi]|uniref:AsmA protein n=2 Tax=Nitrobacter winogradskyi TaxID=913 RepID=A0ACC6AL29_NITWI|nr:AsmA family protein [Nitrobacter winogradskyi]MCP2000094.1 AsmA protein [Nitrobacter winogradskyi]GEC15731.1 cell envelope biogenesis protein AsmA [Nitrobacter winogradskyi]
MARALKIAGAVAASLVAIVIVLLVTGVPSRFVTSLVQDRIERDTGYRIAINGTTGIELWPSPGFTLHHVTFDRPANAATDAQLAVGEVRATLALASLLSGTLRISELAIDHPTLRAPLLRERTGGGVPSGPDRSEETAEDDTAFPIGRVTVSNGAIVFFDPQTGWEDRIDDVNTSVTLGADRRINITGDARPGGRSLTFAIAAIPPAGPLGRRNIPTELTLEVSGAPTRQLTARAEVRINRQTLLINGLSGSLDDGKFNGWASVDLASKPLVKVDLDFQKLDLSAAPGEPSAPRSGTQSWSNTPIDVGGLNYVDAQGTISAAELTIGRARFAPAQIEAAIARGVLKASVPNLGVYDGRANGSLSIDASSNNPSYALKAEVTGVRALPLLSSLADFDNIDGRMRATADVRGAGASLRAIMSSLAGTASIDVRDGAIRNLNIAKMIRALTSGTLSGWQERPDQTTDLSQLSATATIAKGQATTNDLFLTGPLVRMTGAGSLDLGAKMLALRVEPKLVLSTEGQGGRADPIGLGIPVAVQGSWSQPRIYPDVAGILDDPGAAYAKLREWGQGLFGRSGIGNSDSSVPHIGETLDTLIRQGLGAGANPAPAEPPATGKPSEGPPRREAPSPDKPPPIDGIIKQLLGR